MNSIVTIIIIVISVIGFISNAVNEQKAKKQPRRNQPPKPRRRLQDEIESFLQEVKQQQPEAERKQAQPQRQAQRQPERKPERRRESRPAPQSRRKAEAAKPTRKVENPAVTRPAAPEKPRTSVLTSKPSPTLASQTSSFANESTLTQTPLASRASRLLVEQGYSQDVINLLTADQMERISKLSPQQQAIKPVGGSKSVGQLLTSESIGSAFVVNEILQPPLALRNRDR